MSRDKLTWDEAEDFVSYNEISRPTGGRKGAKMAKKTFTVDSSWIGGTKGKALGAVLAVILTGVVAFNVGDSGGYKRGLDEGNHAGFDRGDKAGFENGYWQGREEGCLWVIQQGGRTYVIGIGNPNGGWLFQNLGDTYIGESNCSTTGHGEAPYSPAPYSSGVEGTN